MSKNKKLNKAVRERMARTGESYSTARMHVLAKLGVQERTPEPLGPVLTAWVADPTPRLPEGTLTRFLVGPASNPAEAKPITVVPMGWRWKVILPHGNDALIQGRFAAPSAEIACAYADNYLHRAGFTGPGIRPLSSEFPALRERENTWVPTRSTSAFDRGVLEEAAKCECGHVGEDIRDRHQPCPSCGGMSIIIAETLLAMTEPA